MVRPTLIVLVLGYLGAIGWGFYEWQRPMDLARQLPADAPDSVPQLEVPQPRELALEGYDSIVEHPLFVAGRRPLVEEQAADTSAEDALQDVPPMAMLDMRLSAVLLDGPRKTALIELASGQTEALHVGESISAWELRDIQPDHVVLVAGDNTYTLLLHDFEHDQATSPSPANDRLARRRTPAQVRLPPAMQTRADSAREASTPQPLTTRDSAR